MTVFNLLPISYLDGGRALHLLFGENAILRLLEFFFVALLLSLGLAAAFEWNAYGLLIMAAIPMFLLQTHLHRRKKQGMI